MNQMLILVPLALALGLVGLIGFFWALRSGQFDDLDGDALRILMDDDEARDAPGGKPSDDAPRA